MSTSQQPQTLAAPAPRAEVPRSSQLQFRITRFLGWFLVRATLIFICVLWTVPTFGLLISSLRDKDALAVSGWWESLQSTITQDQGRSGTAADQIEQEGRYIISGNLLPEGDRREISSFGLTATGFDDFAVGETATTNEGFEITVLEDGTYRLISMEPIPESFSRGQRITFQAETPPRLTLENYDEVINTEGLGDAFLNTATVTIPATIIPIAIAAFAAYAFSWMRFPGRLLLLSIVVGLIVVPLQLSLIPVLRVYNTLELRGTYPGIWLAHTGFGLPLAVFLLYNYISSLPRDLIESAQIDGASHFDIFIRLVVPLSVPALASFTIFQFLWVWNDLLVALVFLGTRPENQVLTSQLNDLVGSRGDNWEIMTASAFVSIAVPLLVFFALQRYFVRGMMAGSVKGG
ncbi:MAG: carbohydrate ABC transporter permease [Anaerolineae bacterium]|nr:carbohydrate ABC transporter permease [Anaerolineae bacterium]